MEQEFKDVTSADFQGCFGRDYCKGIDKPGKYIIRVIDYNWRDNGCYKDPVLGPLYKKLDTLEYGTPEYKETESQIYRLFGEKFGFNSDAWKPKKVEIEEVYGFKYPNGDVEKAANVIKVGKKWYYYNGNHACFKSFENKSEVNEYFQYGRFEKLQ